MESGFPIKSESFINGQDVLYKQFNDIEFYVEDIEQENFYFLILKKIFIDIKFEKIFPLGGKEKVLKKAGKYKNNKKKVFIVDLDFDDILNRKKQNNNVFYLNKYSIENHLINENATKEIIIEIKPRIKINDINKRMKFKNILNECKKVFSDLICHYIIIQKYELGIKNVDSDTGRFCNFNTIPAGLKRDQLKNYKKEIIIKLQCKSIKISIRDEINKLSIHFNKLDTALSHIPGKYILNLIKYRIEHLFSLPSMSLESFTYRMAKNSRLEELKYLENKIRNYIR